MTGRVCCFNSFWGLERAQCIPPNFKLVGSLNKPQNALIERLIEKDKVLYDWLEEAQTLKMDVVLVSIGTICRFQKWSLDALHEGLKALKNTRVIWSLKDNLCEMASNDPRKTKDFWVGSWLPQVEVLAHPAIKLAIIHCGWGSVLEIIDAGVPTLNFPHFGD